MTHLFRISPASLLWPLAVVVGLLPAAGFGQGLFRKRADRAAREVLEEKARAAKWELQPGVMETDRRSRFHDPGDPDDPPKPPDDPQSAELMRRVDGKRGARSWASEGEPSPVESGIWREFLPRDREGRVKLDLENAVRLALLHSRSMQRAREELYLGALDVTEQRFRFDVQPTLLHDLNRVVTGKDRPGGNVQTLAGDSLLSFDRQIATGADFVLGLANSVLWDFTQGGVEPAVASVINVGVVQPLLRFRAREFVIEDLTQVERTLLANVRRMKQFQQAFYIDVISGRNLSNGPSRRNPGGSDAPFVAGSPGGFGSTGGFFGLLQTRQQIRNQESSVAALRDSLAQLQAAFDAGRIRNRLQVDQAKQALYNGQSRLLTAKAGFESSVDSYKVELGLPPDLEVVVEDDLLERFNLVDPAISRLQNDVADALDELRRKQTVNTPTVLQDQTLWVVSFESRVRSQIERGRRDIERLRAQLPKRREQLRELRALPELDTIEVDPELLGDESLEGLDERLESNIRDVEEGVGETMKSLRALAEVKPPQPQLERARNNVVSLTTNLSSLLLELSLIQAAARLEAVALNPVQLEYADGLRLAEEHRLDWMNARARLVDSWRQIAVDAEALKTGLDLIVNGEVPTVGNSAEDFSRDSARFRFGLQLDSPLRRLTERNDYRETLIEYQRARREFMLFEDELKRSLRNTLRIVKLSQINFEVRRAAVRVAVAQVDLARLRLNEPPKPGAAGAQFGATTARDLVSALGDLLDAQNDFLNVWVSFEVLRVLLDYELGTMVLDERGAWQDPGVVTVANLEAKMKRDRGKESDRSSGAKPVVEVAPASSQTEGQSPGTSARSRGHFGAFRKY